MRAIVENCPYLLQSATRDPTTGIQTPSAEVEAEQAVAAAQDGPRQVPPEAEADEAAPAEAAGGERQPPRPRLPPPPRSDGDAAADPSARKENLKRKEGRMREVQWTISNGNRTMRRRHGSERVFSQNLN